MRGLCPDCNTIHRVDEPCPELDDATLCADMGKDEKIRRLETALEFYANPGDYVAPFTGGLGKLWQDCGMVARVALGEAFHGEAKLVERMKITPYPLID